MPKTYTLLYPKRLQYLVQRANYFVPICLGDSHTPIEFEKLNALLEQGIKCHECLTIVLYGNDKESAEWFSILDAWCAEHADSALAGMPRSCIHKQPEYQAKNDERYRLAHLAYEYYQNADKIKKRVLRAARIDKKNAKTDPNPLYITMALDMLAAITADKDTIYFSFYKLPHRLADIMRNVGRIGYKQNSLIVQICHFVNELVPTIYKITLPSVAASPKPEEELMTVETPALPSSLGETTTPKVATVAAAATIASEIMEEKPKLLNYLMQINQCLYQNVRQRRQL